METNMYTHYYYNYMIAVRMLHLSKKKERLWSDIVVDSDDQDLVVTFVNRTLPYQIYGSVLSLKVTRFRNSTEKYCLRPLEFATAPEALYEMS